MADHDMTRRRKGGPPVSQEVEHEREVAEKRMLRVNRRPVLLDRSYWVCIPVVFVVCCGVVSYYENWRPSIVPKSDFSTFSGARAFEATRKFSEMGPRPSGSHALEKEAMNYIYERLVSIAAAANSTGVNRIEKMIHRHGGVFDVDFIIPYTDTYFAVTNVVARMGPPGEPRNTSLLVNCHFDTQPDAPGATDDAVSCAIMLDIMELLARGQYKLQNDVVFLFNGAEESGLQGSHSFITKSNWRHSVKNFINLEGAGGGGREILFQTGPGNMWLSEVYVNSVPYPSCSILGQELFTAKVIPSDTDFRIFRDYGKISGLDIAYFQNGWVYHTEFDDHTRIREGDIQRTGENIWALVKGIDSSEYLAQATYEDDRRVFFDLLGKYVFRPPFVLVLLLQIVALLWNISTLYQIANANDSIPRFHGFVFSCVTYGLLLCLPVGFIIRQLAWLLNFQFFWYKAIWQCYVFYFFPYVFAGLYLIYSRVDGDVENRFRRSNAYYEATNFVLSAVSFAACLSDSFSGSSVYILILLVCVRLRQLCHCIMRQFWAHEEWSIFVSTIISMVPFTIIYVYLSNLLLYILVPTLGRTGMKVPDPDSAMSGLTTLICSGYIWLLAPLVPITNWQYGQWKAGTFRRHLPILIGFAMMIALLALTPLGTSYRFDSDIPKLRRIHATHMDRTFYHLNGSIAKRESGIVVQGLDFRKTEDLPDDPKFFNRMQRVDCSPFWDHADEGCGLPFVVPKWPIFRPQDAKIIPAEQVEFEKPINVKLINKTTIHHAGTLPKYRIELEITGGTDKMGFHVSPALMYVFANSSVTYDPTMLNRDLKSNRTFFFTLDSGYEMRNNPRVWFEVNTAEGANLRDVDRRTIEVVVVALYTHGDKQHTSELKALKEHLHRKRAEPDAEWRWLMTMVAATAEVKVYQF